MNTQAEQIFDDVLTLIIRGQFEPGEKLSEQVLADRFGGSRAVTREVIQRLEARSLVKRIPHVGARVVSLTLAELKDIYEVRLELESMACRLAARHANEDDIVNLRNLLQDHARAIRDEDGQSYYQEAGDLDFHFRIIQASKSERLKQILCGEIYHLVRMYRFRTSNTNKRPQQALQEHQRIVEAIAEHDSEMAELLMRRHIQTSIHNLERLMAENGENQ